METISSGLEAEDFPLPTAYCESRAETKLDELTVSVMSLTDLKQNKRASGRCQDFADLEMLP